MNKKTLQKGSKGSEVKELQELLNEQISAGLTVDGIFGSKTLAAVKAYQTAKGLKVDGIVGYNTWCALLGIVKEDIVIPCEDLKQYSSPHGSMIYGPDKSYSTYASGGCGVTSFAVVYRALGLAPDGESSTETIQRLGKYAWEHGYRIKGNGTTHGLFGTNGCSYKATGSASAIENALRSGQLVILLIKKGFPNGYTGSGHYIVAYGIEGANVLLRDVGSGKASRQKAALNKITSGLKYAYIMSC